MFTCLTREQSTKVSRQLYTVAREILGSFFSNSYENFISGRVIFFLQKNIIDARSLFGRTEAFV